MRRHSRIAIGLILAASACGCAARSARQLHEVSPAAPANDPAAMTLDQIEPRPTLSKLAATEPSVRPPAEALLLYARARDALLTGKRYTAINALEEAIRLDPKSPSLHVLLAAAYQGGRAWDERSIEALQKAAELSPDDLQVQLSLGRQLLSGGDLALAQHHLRLARQTSDYAQGEGQAILADYFLARTLQLQGYDRAALELYSSLFRRAQSRSSSIGQDPEVALVLSQSMQQDIGDLYFKHGLFEAALKAFAPAAKAAPTDFDAQSRFIRALMGLGRFDQAVDGAATLAIALGGERQAVLLLSEACAAAGHRTDALRRVQEAAELRAGGAADLLAVARAAVILQAPAPEVASALAAARRAAGGDVELLYVLAGIYQEAVGVPESEAVLEQILALAPDHAGASNDLAYLLAEKEDNLARAQQLAAHAVALNPGRIAYLDTLGWVYYKRGEFADAQRLLRQATNDPGSAQPVIFDHLGDALYRLGDAAGASECWKQAQLRLSEAHSQPLDRDEARVSARVQRKLSQAQQGQAVDVASVASAEAPPRAAARRAATTDR